LLLFLLVKKMSAGGGHKSPTPQPTMKI